jgi:hypothetical protein
MRGCIAVDDTITGTAKISVAWAEQGLHGFIQAFLRDVLSSARTMRKRRGFAATVVLILAIGVRANTALFVARAVLLKPFAFREPDRIVRLSADQ